MARILGVDCSTQSIAFALFDGKRLVEWGEVSFGKGDILHRINNANRTMNAMVSKGFFADLDAVYFESAIYVNNRSTVINLAYAFGAAISPLIKPGVRAIGVSPITWQSFIGNKIFTKVEKAALKDKYPSKTASWLKEEMRRQRKQKTIDFVKAQFGVTAVSDNVSDSIALGWYGVHQEENNGK